MMPNEMAPICGFGGVSILSGGASWIDTGFFSEAGVSYLYVALAHELGHQLNMQHAQAYQSDGSLVEYGDNSCPMGDEDYVVVNFNVPHLIEEGWMPLSHINQVTQSGAYQVALAENQTADFQALQVAPLGHRGTTLYVSYRQPIGLDSNLLPSFTGGVTIHFWNGANNKSQLAWGGTLNDGQTYTYPGGGLKITQISHNNNNVTLNVDLDASIQPIGSRHH
jgi:hypothetical protein